MRAERRREVDCDLMHIQNPIWSAVAARLARDIPLRDLFGRFGDRPALLLESNDDERRGQGGPHDASHW